MSADASSAPAKPVIDCLPEFVPYGSQQDLGERENFDSVYRALISSDKRLPTPEESMAKNI